MGGGERLGSVDESVGDHDCRPLGDETFDDRRPDAAGRTGHECGAAGETPHLAHAGAPGRPGVAIIDRQRRRRSIVVNVEVDAHAPFHGSPGCADRHHDRQIDETGGGVELERPEVELRPPLRLAHQLAHADDREDGSVLDDVDEHVAHRRERDPHHLRNQNEAGRLPVAQSDRLRRLTLSRRDGLEPGSEHLGQVGAVEQAEGDDPGLHGCQRDPAGNGEAVEQPQHEDVEGDAAEHLDEHEGQHADPAQLGQSQTGERQTAGDGDEHRGHGDAEHQPDATEQQTALVPDRTEGDVGEHVRHRSLRAR